MSEPFTSEIFEVQKETGEPAAPSVPHHERSPSALYPGLASVSGHGDVNAFQPKCPQILNSIWCNFLLFAAASLTSLAVNAVLSVPFLLSRSVSGKLLKLIYAKRINV